MNPVMRMKELIPKILEADTAYYKLDAPIMSDRAYDKFYDELLRLEQDSGIILGGSPTQKTPGELLEGLVEVRHTRPMLSAGKTKSVDELMHFMDGRVIVLSWKLDGLTLVLRYEDGRLKQAITRGREGLVGEDVTHTVRHLRNVPLQILCKEPLEVRGEGVVSWANFQALNDTLEEPYTAPRSLAAGSVRKLDANEAMARPVEFIAFDLISDSEHWDSKHEQLAFLEQQGFDVVPHMLLDAGTAPEHIREKIAALNPADYTYPVDGLIVEFNDLPYGRSLGATGHHENRLMALKWQDTLYATIFRGVELATTRTGMVSITGVFDDVMINGATVNHAYLHNLDIFDEFQFGIGDTIQVYRANMINPQIADNLTQSNTFELPMVCPCCGEGLTVKKTPGGTRQLFCENSICPAKLVRKFVHFCSKTRMEIEGLSELTLEKFIQKGWLRNFGDLYELERYQMEIIVSPGFGVKSFDRLQAAIDKRRTCTLNQFIAALGIPMVGRHAGRELNRHFHGSWEAFEQAIQDNFDFTTLPDFGQTMHDNIYAWYADHKEAELWRPALKHITFEKETEIMSTVNNPFTGKVVVATGKLENYTREGIQLKLLSLGAKPTGSVSKKTDYLIVGEKAGSKLAKAQSLGVKVLSEQDFEQMLADAGI